MKNKITLFLLSSLFVFSSCDKFLDIKPTGSVIPETLDEYRALLTGAYYGFPRDRGMACLGSDEMQVEPGSWDFGTYGDLEKWIYHSVSGSSIAYEWLKYYNTIFIANEVINAKIKNGSQNDIDQLVGEAYMLRAYSHFVLVNLYGQPYTKPGALQSKAVPLKLSNNLEKYLKRNTVEEVYKSILTDIKHAEELITAESWESTKAYRFNTKSVHAFYARVYLYMGNWKQAYDNAELVIAAQPALEDLNAPSPVLPNLFTSVEVITALESTPSPNLSRGTVLGAALISLYNTEDMRFALYFSAPNADGYMKSEKTGYNKFNSTFRTAEFYLTTAEAAAQLNNLPQSRTRLLELMAKRYSATGYTAKETAVNAMGKDQLVEEILNERARELAYEGHRWYDLRRTTRPQITKVLESKTYILKQNDILYTISIPLAAIKANPGLND